MDCGPWRPFLSSASDCDALPILARCYQTHTSCVCKMKDGNLRQCLHVQCKTLSLPAGLCSPVLCKQHSSIHHQLWWWYRNFSFFSCWLKIQTWSKFLGSTLSFLFFICFMSVYISISSMIIISFPPLHLLPHEAAHLLEMWNARK